MHGPGDRRLLTPLLIFSPCVLSPRLRASAVKKSVEVAMNSIAEYIMDRTGIRTWTDDEPAFPPRETEVLVNVVAEACARLGAKTGKA